MKNWVIVASAARARIFEVGGHQTPWKELMDLVNTSDRLLRRELTSDKPGRVIDNARGQRHTMDPPVDPKEQAATQFAKQLGEKLEAAFYDKRFNELTLVAAPHFLGLLRKHMGTELTQAVKQELAKDLTREAAASLPAHLAELA